MCSERINFQIIETPEEESAYAHLVAADINKLTTKEVDPNEIGLFFRTFTKMFWTVLLLLLEKKLITFLNWEISIYIHCTVKWVFYHIQKRGRELWTKDFIDWVVH